MRHKVAKHSFGRKQGPRKALMRSLVDALVEHGRIRTTLPKAKELRRFVERAVTKGKEGTLHARRVLLSKYPNKNTVETLMTDLGVRFKDRNGGYTRIIKMGPRPGDMAEMALIEFVDYEPKAVDTDEIEAKKAKKSQIRVKKHKKAVRKIQDESRRVNRR